MRVDPVFFLLAALLGLQHTEPVSVVLFVLIALVSVLWHELGHALAFRAFGYESAILLHGMGGLTMPATDRPLPPARDLVVSLAGPLAGIVVGGAVLAVSRPDAVLGGDTGSVLEVALTDIVWVNLGWGVLNLVPILPMDGGRVMASLLDLATGGRGARPARYLSIGIGVALGAGAALFGYVFAALLLGWFVYANVQDLRALRPPPPAGEIERRLSEGWDALARGAGPAASDRARAILRSAEDPEVRREAVTLLGWTMLVAGNVHQGAKVLDSVAPDPSVPVLHPSAVAAAGGPRGAVELLRQALTEAPGDRNGVRVAKALVEAGEVDEALALVSGPIFERAGSNPASVVCDELFRKGRFEDAARLGEGTFGRAPHPTLAYNVACSWARADRPVDALRWLQQAVDTGFADAAALDAEPHFDTLRDMPAFAEIRARVAAHR